MRARHLLVPLALTTVLASGALAAPKPQLTDPKGDYPVAGADIVSATLSTLPGAKGKLQIDLALAAAPTAYSYSVNFIAGDCSFAAIYYGHPAEGVFSKSGVGCRVAGSTSLPEGSFKIKGSTITFTVPLTGALKKGVTVTDITAGTAPSGMISGSVAAALGDNATTNATYKIGS